MPSAKERKEEKERRKSKAKPKNAETRTKAKPSPKKNNKKTAIQNGTVNDSKVLVTAASSSNNDSQQDSETKQDSRSQEQEAGNEKKKKPNKNGKKIERDDDDDDEDSEVCNFPMGRIKRIFKTQSSDFRITGEAVFLINKATDKFLEQFCEDAYECCAKDRKKSLAYKHLAIVSEQSKYEFLSDYVPEKIKAEDALAQRKLAEGGEG